VLSDDAAADTADVSSTSGLVPSGSSELAALQPTEDRAPTRAEVEMIIDEMQTLDLQSDQRFAESLVRRRAERQGVSQVARLLRNHQIDPAISDALLDQLRRSELERARHIWSRRFGRIATDLREKSRQSRFLSNRGFSPDVISRVLRGDPSGDTGHLE
jgi:regulatory protein